MLLVVFYLAFSPNGDPLPDFLCADKLKHAAAFSLLSLLFWVGYRVGPWAVLFWMAGIGFFIEGVQYFLPWREASGWDILADMTGILAALYVRRRLPLDQS